jgi:hypothetical protein
MAKATDIHSTCDDRLEELEAPICAAIDMAALCTLAFDHISREGIPDGSYYIRVNLRAWNILGFALRHQQEIAKALLVAFERADAP